MVGVRAVESLWLVFAWVVVDIILPPESVCVFPLVDVEIPVTNDPPTVVVTIVPDIVVPDKVEEITAVEDLTVDTVPTRVVVDGVVDVFP